MTHNNIHDQMITTVHNSFEKEKVIHKNAKKHENR